MKMITVKNIARTLLFLVLLGGLGCEKETAEPDLVTDEELVPYFTSFRTEAELRNRNVEERLSGITGRIGLIPGSTVAGQCQTAANGDSHIQIDQAWWNGASEYDKEFLIFHELGHCALGRAHDDASDVNGFCISIMHSSSTACDFIYKANTRDGYLDELFSK